MRLWTLHPKHLDPAGLVALWRETLLAQAVLQGKTKGYTKHPQLIRFQRLEDPIAGIGTYLAALHEEAMRRGYNFDRSKINAARWTGKITETKGQLLFEWRHLEKKLLGRNPAWHRTQHEAVTPAPHPLFRIVAGGVREWEKG